MNYQNIKKNPQRISKIKSFIDQYNWKEIDFPSHQKDWKKSELKNKSFTLNTLFVPYNTEQIRPAYKSKYNFKRKNQAILLIITGSEKWYYLAVKYCPQDFYYLNYFHSYSTEKNVKTWKSM